MISLYQLASFYIDLYRKDVDNMNTSIIPFNQTVIQNVIGNGEIEEFVISTTKKGYKKLELQVYYPDGSRKFFLLKDKRFMIEQHEIFIYPFESKKERDYQIYKLYSNKKKKLTQEFIGKIFGLKQSTVSGIINKFD